MSLEQLEALELDLVTSVTNLLLNNTKVNSMVNGRIFLTEEREILPVEYDFPMIQIKDPSIDFEVVGSRQQNAEDVAQFLEIFCYDWIRDLTPGSTLAGNETNTGLLKLVGAVNVALYNQKFDHNYWCMPVSISTSSAIVVRGEEGEEDEVVCVKTLLYKLKKYISTFAGDLRIYN